MIKRRAHFVLALLSVALLLATPVAAGTLTTDRECGLLRNKAGSRGEEVWT